jgi:hypothetical protein
VQWHKGLSHCPKPAEAGKKHTLKLFYSFQGPFSFWRNLTKFNISKYNIRGILKRYEYSCRRYDTMKESYQEIRKNLGLSQCNIITDERRKPVPGSALWVAYQQHKAQEYCNAQVEAYECKT